MYVKKEFELEDTSGARLRASAEGIDAFVKARFGLSVHWGLYCVEGRGEWVMHWEQIPHDVYRERMARFNPTRFEPEEWADLMVETGQKALLITAKHHDGFCLWDTALTDFKATRAAYGRDILAELAPVLRARDIALHFYYSLLDWTHSAYRDDWPAYVAYYQGQLRELCTNYGPIGGVLFDGYWPSIGFFEEMKYFEAGGPWDLAGACDLIHQLQPDAVIVNNSHVLPLPGEDYQIWELDMPGESRSHVNTKEIGDCPTATWWNLNSGWGYEPRKHCVKRPEVIVEALRKALAMDAFYWLNVGPRPFGDIHPEEQQALRAIGRYIREFKLLPCD